MSTPFRHNRRPKMFRRKNNRNRNPQVSSGVKPPQIKSNIVVHHKYRFASAAASSFALTGINILGAIGTVCTVANTTASHIAQSFKVNSIEIWCQNPIVATSATCSVEWIGTTSNSVNSSVEVSDTSLSAAYPAHIKTSPPKGSTSSFWQTPSVSNFSLANIVTNQNCIIDLDLSYVLRDDDAIATTSTIAAGTLGFVYYLAMDGPTTHVYPPVSLTTTF